MSLFVYNFAVQRLDLICDARPRVLAGNLYAALAQM
jgi:hypothetical protein